MTRFNAELNYNIIEKNLILAKSLLKNAEFKGTHHKDHTIHNPCIAGVLKANAGGLGIVNVAPILHHLGIKTYFVATILEGITLRNMLQDVTIYILSDDCMPHLDTLQHYHLSPIINDICELPFVQNKPIPIGIHLNSGINRLGLTVKEWDPFLQHPNLLKQYHVTLLMSHLAKTPIHDFDNKQYHQFYEQTSPWKNIPKSLCASKGFFLPKDFHFNMIRTASMIFGHDPTKYKGTMSPLTIKAKILKIFTAHKGEQIGYDGATLKQKKNIAMLGFGTQDGLPSFPAQHTRKSPIIIPIQAQSDATPYMAEIISVSMDMLSIHIPDKLLDSVKYGDWLTIFIPKYGTGPLAKQLDDNGCGISGSAIATKIYVMGYRDQWNIKGLKKPYVSPENNLYPQYSTPSFTRTRDTEQDTPPYP